MDNTSGLGKASIVPSEVEGWNWGAFFLHWIWGLFNATPIALLMFVPGAGLIMMFVLGVKGNEWAWRNQNWQSIEHFKSVQRKWAMWGIGLAIGGLFLLALALVSALLS